MAQGHAALAVNDRDTALAWLERAHRLVPEDPNVILSLASCCLVDDPLRAARLFGGIADVYDVRQAWMGLAAAHLRMDQPAAARAPLAAALSQHAFQPDIGSLANRIACEPVAPGWCALASDGTLAIHQAVPTVVEVRLDGKPIRGTTLPVLGTNHRRIDVLFGGKPAIGSPIRIDTIRRVVGCVEAWEGGIRGWAWHPGDPDTPVALTLVYANAGVQRFTATAETIEVADAGPLARPRGFCVGPGELANSHGAIHVRGPDGKDLLGSPLDPTAESAAHRDIALRLGRLYPACASMPANTPPTNNRSAGDSRAINKPRSRRAVPSGPSHIDAGWPGHSPHADIAVPAEPTSVENRQRAAVVVIPVHDGTAIVMACLTSVLRSVAPGTRIVVIDDGSTDPALIAMLDDLARQRMITLVRHPRALGFPASANAGMQAANGCDVVLLNSDTLVPPGWLQRLQDAADSAPGIGTVTPFSNDASILSYPGDAQTNPRPDQAATNRLDRLARRANGGTLVDIPVGVGFCMYIRRDCLNIVGVLRANIFAQGYGEESDFCLRARHLGWRNVALTGLFVGHHGGTSFGTGASHLRARNAGIIERLHPGHDALIARFAEQDPLAEARRRIDLLRWRDSARSPGAGVTPEPESPSSAPGQPLNGGGPIRSGSGGRGWRQAAILIAHDDGGGVEARLASAARAHAAAGRRPIVLRPAKLGGVPAIAVHDGVTRDYPNLIHAMPRHRYDLLRLLRSARPVCVEVHHLLDHPQPAIQDLVATLGIPYDVHVHDYAWVCPRVSLVGAQDRYCGEPDVQGCEACIADHGHFLNEDISVAGLRARSAAFLAGARQVITPSDDTSARIRRHFSSLRPVTIPHEDDAAIPWTLPAWPARRPGHLLVCVAGAIGLHKGYNVLLACARDAARRDLALDFVVVGHSIDDARLLATGRIFVTGRYHPQEAVHLIMAQRAQLGFVPSICPETWCLGLGDLWRAGLPVAAFDIGAPAERIQRTGRGFLLPLGLAAGAINNALVAAGTGST